MNHSYRILLLAALAISLTACVHQPTQFSKNDIIPITAEFELTTADGTRTTWTSVNTKPASASHTSETPTGTVHVVAHPAEPLSYLSVSVTRMQWQAFSTAAGDSGYLPTSVEIILKCRIAKGETCAVVDVAGKTWASVRWKA